MRENIIASGNVLMTVTDVKSGKIIDQYSGKNLVVNVGKQNVARLLGGLSSGKPITKIGFGEGTTAPAVGNTSLTNAFTKDIDSVNYPSAKQVQFVFSLSASEANGMNITELGLFNSSNVLFSRKTRSAIAKTSSVIITGIWTITIN